MDMFQIECVELKDKKISKGVAQIKATSPDCAMLDFIHKYLTYTDNMEIYHGGLFWGVNRYLSYKVTYKDGTYLLNCKYRLKDEEICERRKITGQLCFKQ